MKILCDENIPFSREAFSQFGEVLLFNGRNLSNSDLKNCDLLVVRSVTEVNEELLENTPVKFVGTATIGTDHIQEEYLASNNIAFNSAKGCNANSVKEYFFTALFNLLNIETNIKKTKLAVVGAGDIGGRLVKAANLLDFKVLVNDPPKERTNLYNYNFVSLFEALNCDIITLHTPLTYAKQDKTYHLINKFNLPYIKEKSIFINCSRGGVVNNEAMYQSLLEKDLLTCFDVWENEPKISFDLLEMVSLGTPHIAGYSLEGRVNGTYWIANSLAEFLETNNKWTPNLEPVFENNRFIDVKRNPISELRKLFNSIYPISRDDAWLRTEKKFDDLRKNYPVRREFSNYEVSVDKGFIYLEFLRDLGFNIIEL